MLNVGAITWELEQEIAKQYGQDLSTISCTEDNDPSRSDTYLYVFVLLSRSYYAGQHNKRGTT